MSGQSCHHSNYQRYMTLEIFQTEGVGNKEAHFELPITITTLNKPTLYNDSLEVELVSGGILYYSNNSLNLLTRGIEIGEIPSTPVEVTASFYSVGTLHSVRTGLPGTNLDLPTEPTRDGYSFNGWDPVVPSVFPSSDTTYTAKWIELSEATSTISMYTGSEGTFIESITGNIGGSVPSVVNPKLDGKSFAGWSPALPEVFPDEDLRVDATWVDSVSDLQVTKVTSEGTTIIGNNNSYKIGNNVDVEIVLTFTYTLPKSNLKLDTTAFVGNFSEIENKIIIKGTDVKPNNSIDITIRIYEVANPNNYDTVNLTLTKN